MKKILHIISSPRGEESNSTLLGKSIIEKILSQHPGSTVVTNNVVDKNYQPLQPVHVKAYKLPDESHTPEQRKALQDSDEAVAQLLLADIVVISIPLYNFNIPAVLKGWVDHVVRGGKTFSYQTGRPEGLVTGRKVYLAIASNGVYSDGPMKPMDHAEPYMRFILRFMGMTDITTYRIEGSGMAGVMETAVKKGLESILI